jgi:hypothetical protein
VHIFPRSDEWQTNLDADLPEGFQISSCFFLDILSLTNFNKTMISWDFIDCIIIKIKKIHFPENGKIFILDE